ncbi:MAG: gamma-glutamylcyclotransferase [Kofleriaceae bacterium]|nr:gamma-glutamylcyclotransferase [Kofleriaceae bacterium]
MTKHKIISLPPRIDAAQEALFPEAEPSPRPPDLRRVRVFAYGSNVDADQIRYRCPSARLVGVATLRGHAMAFAGHSASRGGPVATVFACEALDVPGALYSMTRDDLARLDRFEGVPWMYTRTSVWVIADGKRRRAEIYRLRAEHVRAGLGTPAPAYLGLIVGAYHRLGIPKDSLSIAITLATRVKRTQPRRAPLTSPTPDPTYGSRRTPGTKETADDDE